MTALLPFELPDDAVVNMIILQQGDVARIRGFFTEAGVLAAVSIGVSIIVAIGAMVLIRLRACVGLAWLGLLSALCMGGAILCITVTKSGFVMIAGGCTGFIAVLLFSRNHGCRSDGGRHSRDADPGRRGVPLRGPADDDGYLRGEMEAAVNPTDMTPDAQGGHSGTITRYKCWQLAFNSLRMYPMGVGSYGLGSVIQVGGGAGLTHEMRYFFSRDNFGLKNALANLIAQDGIVGIGLLGYWIMVAFIRPIRQHLADGSSAEDPRRGHLWSLRSGMRSSSCSPASFIPPSPFC